MLNLCVLGSIRQMDLLEFMMELDILYYLEVKNFIYNRIRYIIGIKSGITYAISHNYIKIKGNSHNFLLPERH